MDTSALLGRVFGVRSSLGSFGGVSGTKKGETLGKVEYSALLSGLNGAALALAFAKYGLDDGAKGRLLAFIVQFAESQHWQCNRVMLENISKLVLDEVLNEGICTSCKGTGVVHSRPCKSCDGVGKRYLSGRKRAKKLEINQTQWVRLWAARYDDIFNYVNQLDSDVLRCLHRGFH